LSLSYLYLGYWIEQSTKMSYKANFRPVEMLRRGHWVRKKADAAPGKG
jgi:arginine-tRNA-protein transferase